MFDLQITSFNITAVNNKNFPQYNSSKQQFSIDHESIQCKKKNQYKVCTIEKTRRKLQVKQDRLQEGEQSQVVLPVQSCPGISEQAWHPKTYKSVSIKVYQVSQFGSWALRSKNSQFLVSQIKTSSNGGSKGNNNYYKGSENERVRILAEFIKISLATIYLFKQFLIFFSAANLNNSMREQTFRQSIK